MLQLENGKKQNKTKKLCLKELKENSAPSTNPPKKSIEEFVEWVIFFKETHK